VTAVSRRPKPVLAAGLTAGGGALVVLSTLLTWFRLSAGSVREDVEVTDFGAGKMILGLGVALVVVGGLIFALDDRYWRMGPAIVGLLLAVFAAVICLYAAYAPLDAFAQLTANAADVGEKSGDVKAGLVDSGIEVGAGIGPWVASMGTILATVGTIAGIAAARRAPRRARARA
jgi:hypothetical protein